MNPRIASIASCILLQFAGGCTNNRLPPAEQHEPINQSGCGVGTNAFEKCFGQLTVTFTLDQIELLYSLTRFHDSMKFESALKGHLFAALDIVEANERFFPRTAAAVQTNQDFITATAYARADPWTNQDVIRVSSESPLRHSEAEIMHLEKNVPPAYAHDFEEMVIDEELSNVRIYLVLTQRAAKDVHLDNRRVADFLISELHVADSYIELFPDCAQKIRNDSSYRAARKWRKHAMVTF